ncbi:MAG: hypothetical protein GF311_17520 [Candidatus Lokiarchaeota archaeon]|nr:hypothetical protein [Candidatus Lokiarchaeota archaeon]
MNSRNKIFEKIWKKTSIYIDDYFKAIYETEKIKDEFCTISKRAELEKHLEDRCRWTKNLANTFLMQYLVHP